MTIYDLYKQRAVDFRAEAAVLRSKYDRFAWVRLTVFVVGMGVSILLLSLHWLALVGWLAVFLGGFYRFMLWHNGVQAAATHAERLATINENEAAAVQHRFDAFPDGARFLHHGHPNALDLDLFGPHSMFQSCCRATTAIGQERLAQYLLEPADFQAVAQRQAAISELKPALDWRQEFQARGLETTDDPAHLDLLQKWLSDPDLVRGNRFLTFVSQLVPWYFLACLAAWATVLSWPFFVLLLVPIFAILKKTNEQVGKIHLRTAYAEGALAAYARLMQVIENQAFESHLLADLRSKLRTDAEAASVAVGRLSYVMWS